MENKSISVINLADFHLFSDPLKDLIGQNTCQSFEAVMDTLATESAQTDFILVTGDMAHDYSEKTYTFINDSLSRIGVPVFCLPGNHDDPDMMKQALGSQTVDVKRFFKWGPWQIIMLNSVILRQVGGRLGAGELALLETCLSANPVDPTMICLHHQPVPVGSAWVDEMKVANAGEFFEIVDRFPQVKGILFGHVHQEYDEIRNGVRLLASPATSIQFTPKTPSFIPSDQPPGYRRIRLFPDGKIETDVKRLENFRVSVDVKAKGY